jgi:UDP-N-acetylmuramoylalanine--D-glutamate ligase
MTTDLAGKRVLLMGLGSRQGGLGVTRYLVSCGAQVRVTDQRNAEQLAATLAELGNLPVELSLGGHREEDVAWADVVVRNPAVPRESPWLALARRLGKPIEMEMSLFLRACSAPVIGVTGTKGKTTTTTLLAAMLRERWPQAVLAGNMGVSALTQLPSIAPDVPVALELSSFQLEGLDEHRLSPAVAVITSISPDHLDRYPTYDDYVRTKAAIVAHQQPHEWAVLSRDDLPELIRERLIGRVATFGVEPVAGDFALWLSAGRFAGRWHGREIDLGPVAALRLPGAHSQLNALAAAAAALAVGVMSEEIARGIAGFSGVPHRLEHVATIGAVDFINDTAATAPAAAVAALRAFAGREVIVVAGGYDKKLPMEPLADELTRSAKRVVLLDGSATPLVQHLLAARNYPAVDGPFDSMEAAVRHAAQVAPPGGVVLLSPGTASFGMFRDEFHRGDAFRAAVRALERGDE